MSRQLEIDFVYLDTSVRQPQHCVQDLVSASMDDSIAASKQQLTQASASISSSGMSDSRRIRTAN